MNRVFRNLALTIQRGPQMHEIVVPLPDGPLSARNLDRVQAAFAEEYTRLYTRLYEGAEIQVLNWRVVCSGPTPG